MALSINSPENQFKKTGDPITISWLVSGGTGSYNAHLAIQIGHTSILIQQQNNTTGIFTFTVPYATVTTTYRILVTSGTESIIDDVLVTVENVYDFPTETILEGDPKLFFGTNGATLNFQNGVPIMDNEFENAVNLQILVNGDSPLNRLASSIDEVIGSNLPTEIKKTITRDQMQIVESAAVDSLSSLVDQGVFKTVTARMSYVSNEGYTLEITITPPVGDNKKLSFVRYNENWISRQSMNS